MLSLLLVVAVLVVFGVYLIYASVHSGQDTTSSVETNSATSSLAISGVVTGLVTVGPSQPVCSPNQSCSVNLTGYSLIFASQCSSLITFLPSPNFSGTNLSKRPLFRPASCRKLYRLWYGTIMFVDRAVLLNSQSQSLSREECSLNLMSVSTQEYDDHRTCHW